MRLLITCGMAVLLAGCAGQPRDQRQAAYDDYWNCAFDAARPYIAQRDLPAREAAARAQVQCNTAYTRYKAARAAYARAVVRPEGRELSERLSDVATLQKRRDLLRRVTEWVEETRG